MKKQESKQSWKKKMAMVLPFIIGIVLGLILAFVLIESDQKDGGGKGVENLYIFLLGMMAAMIFHIVTHEAGHLVCGLLSGYRFVSFRIGSFTLVRTKGQWKIKRFNIPGTGGQCLMAPPTMDANGDYPGRLYNLGGVLVNLIFSVLFTVLAVVYKENALARHLYIAFAGLGYVMFLSNGIPAKIGGIANDGYNLFSMDKDPVGKHCFYLQLDLNARLSDGERLADLAPEYVQIAEDADVKNPLVASAKMFEYYWYAEQHQFEKAAEIVGSFDSVQDKMIPLLQNMITVERIYLALIGVLPQDTIDSMLTKEVKTYLKNAKYDVHTARIRYGVELMKDPSSVQTQKAKAHFQKVVKNSPVWGEAQLSQELAEYMEVKLAKDYS